MPSGSFLALDNSENDPQKFLTDFLQLFNNLTQHFLGSFHDLKSYWAVVRAPQRHTDQLWEKYQVFLVKAVDFLRN